jgi:hypothetical protein
LIRDQDLAFSVCEKAVQSSIEIDTSPQPVSLAHYFRPDGL